MAELPGILRWAVDGWRDLEANGWTRPARTRDTIEELERLGSPVKAFIADRLSVANGAETSVDVLYREWSLWCDSAGRKEHGTTETFGRDLRAALPAGVRKVRRRVSESTTDRRQVVYVGLGLQPSRGIVNGGSGMRWDASRASAVPYRVRVKYGGAMVWDASHHVPHVAFFDSLSAVASQCSSTYEAKHGRLARETRGR